MIKPTETQLPEVPLKTDRPKGTAPILPRAFVVAAAALIVGFSVLLYRWAQFALQSDLYSYVLLVPAVSIYLFRSGFTRPSNRSGSSRALGITLLCLGALVLAGFLFAKLSGEKLGAQDATALSTLSFVLLLAAAAAFFLDRQTLRHAAFPLAFLVFMVPFPLAFEQAIEGALQHGSAPPAYWFYRLAGTPVFKEGMVFQLPGMTLQIAPECSGIRSTLVLFMTSLIAGHLFLRSPWKRTILAVAVIPLALLRNGFRVFVIGELCVHVGPHMIDSPIHHYGGPIFFALSLIPFAVLVYYLVKSDRPRTAAP